MESNDFLVGQTVVCIDDSGGNTSWMGLKHFPTRGRVYTVSALHDCKNGYAVGLVEIPDDPSTKVPSYIFHTKRFAVL